MSFNHANDLNLQHHSTPNQPQQRSHSDNVENLTSQQENFIDKNGKSSQKDGFTFLKRSDVPKAIVSFLRKSSNSESRTVNNNETQTSSLAPTSNYYLKNEEHIKRIVQENERLNTLARTIKITRPLVSSPTTNNKPLTENERINENKNMLRRKNKGNKSRSPSPYYRRPNRSSSPPRRSPIRSHSPRYRNRSLSPRSRSRSPSIRRYTQSPSPRCCTRSPSPRRYVRILSPLRYSRSPPPRRYSRSPSPRRYSRSPSPRRYRRSSSPPRRYNRSPSPPRRYNRSPSPPRRRNRSSSPRRRSPSPVLPNGRRRSPSPYCRPHTCSPSSKKRKTKTNKSTAKASPSTSKRDDVSSKTATNSKDTSSIDKVGSSTTKEPLSKATKIKTEIDKKFSSTSNSKQEVVSSKHRHKTTPVTSTDKTTSSNSTKTHSTHKTSSLSSTAKKKDSDKSSTTNRHDDTAKKDTTKPTTSKSTLPSPIVTSPTKTKRRFSNLPTSNIVTYTSSHGNSPNDPITIEETSPTKAKKETKSSSSRRPSSEKITVSTESKANDKPLLDQEYLHHLPVDERDDVVMDINPTPPPINKPTCATKLLSLGKNVKFSLKKESVDASNLTADQVKQPAPKTEISANIVNSQGQPEKSVSGKEMGSQLVPEHRKEATTTSNGNNAVHVNDTANKPSEKETTTTDNQDNATTITATQNNVSLDSRAKKKRSRLPAPWRVRMSDEGDIYYFNSVTGEETFVRPEG